MDSLLMSIDVLRGAIDVAHSQDDTETVKQLMSLLMDTVRIVDQRVARSKSRLL
jgi:hypothetical protein